MNDIYAYRYARLIQNKISVYRYTNLNDLSINNTPQSKYRYIFRYTTIISNIYPSIDNLKLSICLWIYKHSIDHLSIDIQASNRTSVYRYTNIQSNICLSIYKHPAENLYIDIQTFNRIYVYRIYVICVCLRIVVFSTYCVVFLLYLSFFVSCVPNVAGFSG